MPVPRWSCDGRLLRVGGPDPLTLCRAYVNLPEHHRASPHELAFQSNAVINAVSIPSDYESFTSVSVTPSAAITGGRHVRNIDPDELSMNLVRVVVSHPSIEPLQSAATFIAHVISPYIHVPGYTRHEPFRRRSAIGDGPRRGRRQRRNQGSAMALNKNSLLSAYRRMSEIRAFEDRLHEENATGDIPGFIHLYSGQEAIAVGVCENLQDTDYIGSTHRGHGTASPRVATSTG